MVIRFLGDQAAGNAVLSGLARDQPWPEGLKAITLVFAFDWLVILIEGVLGQLSGATTPVEWRTIVLAAIWAGVFGHFRFMKA